MLERRRAEHADRSLPRLTRSQLRAAALEALLVDRAAVEVHLVVPTPAPPSPPTGRSSDRASAPRAATSTSGTPIGVHTTAGDLTELADRWRTITTTPTGLPLDVGRASRTPTPAQRAALWARDGGCIFPGCTAPARPTAAHHLQPWEAGGPTDLANLSLLCARHHRPGQQHHRRVAPSDDDDAPPRE